MTIVIITIVVVTTIVVMRVVVIVVVDNLELVSLEETIKMKLLTPKKGKTAKKR